MVRILVVDDDRNMRASLCDALSRRGYEADPAGDAGAALRMAETANYQAVITEIRMPGKGGLELLDELKRLKPEMPVVLITAYGTVETAVEAVRKGADDYLLKPFGADALDDSLRRVLGFEVQAEQAKPQASGFSTKRSAASEREIVTVNPRMKRLLEMAEKTAGSNSPIFIHGESGTGKELVARFIHRRSNRAGGPFIAVNCAALPENLLESELFGHEKGAFTGAANRKLGKFEAANGGTLLLDEITEMDVNLQAKMLRVLQEKEVDRVGGVSPVKVDVRVIATTNRVVDEAIREGKFRRDLYFRLNVIPLELIPLRERPEDIPALAGHFLRRFAENSGANARAIAVETMETLKKCRWSGNVRELENVLERAALLCHGDEIMPEDLFLSYSPEGEQVPAPREWALAEGLTMEQMERRLILGTLEKKGNNRTRAAEMLGISIRTLRNRLNAYKIKGKGK